jgi:carbamoyl-phosphate synthase small subunit
MTAPQIGNTGINLEDYEGRDERPAVAGFVLRDPSRTTSNWRADTDLDTYLKLHGIVAIGGVDTRALTTHIRDNGAQNGCIGSDDAATLVDRARALPSMEGQDLVQRVTTAAPYAFSESRGAWQTLGDGIHAATVRHKIVAIDYGAKRNILRCLVDTGFDVTVLPASSSVDDVLSLDPEGIFLSNGPGDPAAVGYAIKTIEGLLGKRPIFGICLGHQLLSLALGARTYKLKFGHRGLNQPVQNLSTKRVEITSQNHGFVVDVDSLGGRAESTYLHLNDGTSEGLSIADASAFSVQFHPEAAAGPHDTLHLFDRFRRSIEAVA